MANRRGVTLKGNRLTVLHGLFALRPHGDHGLFAPWSWAKSLAQVFTGSIYFHLIVTRIWAEIGFRSGSGPRYIHASLLLLPAASRV
jgi:hypothetical protein